MKTYRDAVEVDDLLLFREGENGRMISHTGDGKVIICKNKIKEGYARVLSVEWKKTCILVTAEQAVKDMYRNMPYSEFVKVLRLYGFKIGFEKPFTRKPHVDETLLYAYNGKGIVVVAQTFTLSLCTVSCVPRLESVTVYCPDLSVHGVRDNLACYADMARSSNEITVFELDGDKGLPMFNLIMRIMNRIDGSLLWPEDAYPFLVAYGSENELDRRSTSLERLGSVPESLFIYKGCRFLQEIKVSCKHEDGNCLACDCYKTCMLL